VVGGVQRVTTATVFGALTTAVAFGPSLFLTEGFARILSQLGYVVILCVIFSLIETKLVLPAHLRHIRVHHDRRTPAGSGAATAGWRHGAC
jgi:multidrug efflux pump subunit AcrB